MAEIMQHLTALADEIGPRPATSDAESRAADYITSVFVARGLEPETHEFDSPRTYSWAFVIYFTADDALGRGGGDQARDRRAELGRVAGLSGCRGLILARPRHAAGEGSVG